MEHQRLEKLDCWLEYYRLYKLERRRTMLYSYSDLSRSFATSISPTVSENL
jgi:hypothetical protein